MLQARVNSERSEAPSLLIVDAQSVKNTDSAPQGGFDGGKQIKGIKRHIAVDTEGLPHAAYVTTANVNDRIGALSMFQRAEMDNVQLETVLVDGGYTGEDFADGIGIILGIKVEVAKRNELHEFKVLPKRWIVERSFAWLDKCRRLWKNCEKKLNTSLQFVNLAFLVLILRRFEKEAG